MSELSLRRCALTTSSQEITDEFRRSMRLEDYFHLGDRRVHPILYVKGNTVVVDTAQVVVTSKWYITVVKIISYLTLLIPLIVGIFVLVKRHKTTVRAHLNLLLIINPLQCLQKLNQQKGHLKNLGISSEEWIKAICDWNPQTRTSEQQKAFEECVDLLMAQGLVREGDLFKKAVYLHKSPACVQLLLERRNISAEMQKQQLQVAALHNHADIVWLLCDRNVGETARHFFNKTLTDKEIRSQWTALFRLNSIKLVNELVEPFVLLFPENRREKIRAILNEVQADCLQWLPHISQHDKPIDLDTIKNAYQEKDDCTLSAVERDRAYGRKCFALVEKLLSSYKKNAAPLAPEAGAYRKLPEGPNGGRTVAWFTEQVALFRNKERQGDKVELRSPSISFTTPIYQRYRWGHTLAPAHLSRKLICPSSYKGKVLTSVKLSLWDHKCPPISFTWADIEGEFQHVMAQNPAENLGAFYQSLIKLVWLTGNTIPLTRGTGSVVESLWAFVHRYWKLPVPILQKEYPQFDVINLSLSLEDFQRNWSRYFSPSTLPPIFLEESSQTRATSA